jgi:hypothetical protein
VLSQVQPVLAAEAGPACLAPEDGELMAKDEDLDIVVPSIRRASRKGDQPAQEQVDEGEEHGSSLPSERPDPAKALLTGLIRVSVPFRASDQPIAQGNSAAQPTSERPRKSCY